MKRMWFGLLPTASLLAAAFLAPPGLLAWGDEFGAIDQRAGACTVTIATDPPFTPPAPYPSKAPYAGNVWHGNEGLWTMVRVDGRWQGLPRNSVGFRQKVFWWHPGFDGRAEPEPELTVTARRLDGAEPVVRPGPATNAYHADFGGWTILSGIDVPTAGCWEITGRYRGQTLSFVVQIEP